MAVRRDKEVEVEEEGFRESPALSTVYPTDASWADFSSDEDAGEWRATRLATLAPLAPLSLAAATGARCRHFLGGEEHSAKERGGSRGGGFEALFVAERPEDAGARRRRSEASQATPNPAWAILESYGALGAPTGLWASSSQGQSCGAPSKPDAEADTASCSEGAEADDEDGFSGGEVEELEEEWAPSWPQRRRLQPPTPPPPPAAPSRKVAADSWSLVGRRLAAVFADESLDD